ncbi:MAG: hypothetical protein O6762_00760 [Thaumarchaeota archaeon]|nr:hypothetical protein [Nitrososphaerota archaeon]
MGSRFSLMLLRALYIIGGMLNDLISLRSKGIIDDGQNQKG